MLSSARQRRARVISMVARRPRPARRGRLTTRPLTGRRHPQNLSTRCYVQDGRHECLALVLATAGGLALWNGVGGSCRGGIGCYWVHGVDVAFVLWSGDT